MSNYNSVRIKKLKVSDLRGAEGHNQRTYKEKGSRIDYTKTELNETLHGSSTGLRDDVLNRLDNTNVKVNKGEHNASTVAIEMVLSVSPEYFRENALNWGEFDREKTDAWKDKVMQTLLTEYGDNLINAELHLDEATPHIHAVITPIVEKTKNKRRTKAQIANNEQSETYKANVLDAKNMFNKAALERLQTITAEPLKELGIERGIKGSKKQHRNTKDYWKKVENLIDSKVRKLMPKIRIKDKPLLVSNKSHSESEQARIKGQVSKFILNVYRDLEGKMSEAAFWKDKYETERNRTALVRKSLKPDEEIENFVHKYVLLNNEKKAEIQALKDELKESNELIDKLVYMDNYNKEKLSEASERLQDVESMLVDAQRDKKRLEVDLERSSNNDNGLHR
jgi:hypothetical protein